MTRPVLLLTPSLMALPAQAHIGHIGEAAGHDHWIAGIAIGAAAGLAIWGALKGRKGSEGEPENGEPEIAEEETGEEEPA